MMARPTFGIRIRTRTANRIAACCAIAASPSLPFKPPCGVGCRARARLRALGLPVVSRSPMPNAVYLIVSYLIVSSIVSSIVSEATPRGLKNLKNT